MGDEAIHKLAEVIRRFIRSSDIFARLGGDEFALILPETCTRGTLSLVGRIHKELDIERLSIPRIPEFEVTATCGIAELKSLDGDPDAACINLLQRADAALYAAKEARGTQMGVSESEGIRLVPLWCPSPRSAIKHPLAPT